MKTSFGNTRFKDIKMPIQKQLLVWLRIWRVELWIVVRKD